MREIQQRKTGQRWQHLVSKVSHLSDFMRYLEPKPLSVLGFKLQTNL